MNRPFAQLLKFALSCLSVLALSGTPALAGYHEQDIGDVKVNRPLPYQEGEISVDQTKLGSQVPLDATFTDDTGAEVRLGDYLNKGRPVILNLGYYQCPMLCGVMNQQMVACLKQVKLDVGKEYDVVNISINPSEVWRMARDKKKSYVSALGEPGSADGWHLLVGEPESINALTTAVGYHYKKVDDQYAHPPVLILLSPQGKVTKYLNALSLQPETMRLALVEASDGKLGSWLDKLTVVCFQHDPSTGQYSKLAVNIMQIGAGLFVLGFLAVMVPLWVKSVKKSNTRVNAAPTT